MGIVFSHESLFYCFLYLFVYLMSLSVGHQLNVFTLLGSQEVFLLYGLKIFIFPRY